MEPSNKMLNINKIIEAGYKDYHNKVLSPNLNKIRDRISIENRQIEEYINYIYIISSIK